MKQTVPVSFVLLIAVMLFMSGCSMLGDLDQDKSVSASVSASSTDSVPASKTATSVAPSKISIFPAQAIVDLDFPSLLLYANVNSQPIPVSSDKYKVGWYLNGQSISNEFSLTAAPFLKAIGNTEGAYVVILMVWEKATGTKLGESGASVVAKKQKPVTVTSHWVSAVPGKGMKYWTLLSGGAEWWEGDADLKLQTLNSGQLNVTIVSSGAPQTPFDMRMLGQKKTFTFSDWKSDGTTITFTYTSPSQQIFTFKFTIAKDGHLTGRVSAP
ncbi:MAG: hypothetical protein PHR56_09530, partial [Dehalococcoidales bacterium]|nr:hypothetical protein [Dehalococcoidales bacterium]